LNGIGRMLNRKEWLGGERSGPHISERGCTPEISCTVHNLHEFVFSALQITAAVYDETVHRLYLLLTALDFFTSVSDKSTP